MIASRTSWHSSAPTTLTFVKAPLWQSDSWTTGIDTSESEREIGGKTMRLERNKTTEIKWDCLLRQICSNIRTLFETILQNDSKQHSYDNIVSISFIIYRSNECFSHSLLRSLVSISFFISLEWMFLSLTHKSLQSISVQYSFSFVFLSTLSHSLANPIRTLWVFRRVSRSPAAPTDRSCRRLEDGESDRRKKTWRSCLAVRFEEIWNRCAVKKL